MKQFIIIPASQTEGMYGYSAIAIEKTQDNLLMLQQYIRSMAGAKAIDSDISSLVYDNPKLDIELLNDEYEVQVDGIHLDEIDEDLFEELRQENDCSVNAPVLTLSTGNYFRIQYYAKYSESEVFSSFTMEDIEDLFK